MGLTRPRAARTGPVNATGLALPGFGGTSLFGGQGSLIASLIGVLIIATLRNGLNVLGVYAFWQLVAIGATLVGAVHVDDWRRRRHGGPDLAGFYGACAGAGQLAKQRGAICAAPSSTPRPRSSRCSRRALSTP